MTGSYYQRIAAFLSCYTKLQRDGGPIPADPIYITDAISLLISEEGYTKEQLQREALERFDVVIPDRYFPEVQRCPDTV